MGKSLQRFSVRAFAFTFLAVGAASFWSACGPMSGSTSTGAFAPCDSLSAPVPTGFDFPTAPATVANWVSNDQTHAMRAHGWYLFAGLNEPAPSGLTVWLRNLFAGPNEPAPSGVAVWRTWCTSTQAFAPTADARPSFPLGFNDEIPNALKPGRRVDPRKAIFLPGHPFYPVPASVANADVADCPALAHGEISDGPTFAFNKDIQVASVMFNSPAYEWIRKQRLYEASVLDGFVPPSASAAHTDIPALPMNSIVLKAMWWPVAGSGYSALPVWSDAPSSGGRYAGFEVQRLWSRAVAVTTLPASAIPPGTTHTVSYLHGVLASATSKKRLPPIVYPSVPVVSTDAFYSVRPRAADLHGCDRAIVDASAFWSYGRRFSPEQGDRLILVALHMMTKEQQTWTFQTAWWSDRPNAGPYAADRPSVPGPQTWRHYLLGSTYGFADYFKPSSGPSYRSLPVVYNPYIELIGDHPIRTNCFACHQRAAYPGDIDARMPHANYLATPGPGASRPAPGILSAFHADDPIFKGLVKTELWAISNRAR